MIGAVRSRRRGAFFAGSVIIFGGLVAGAPRSPAQEELFKSKRITPPGEYTRIEGPAVDAAGVLYVVNFGQDGIIGMLKPNAAKSERFTPLPKGSAASGIRFDREGRMYVTDFTQHKVWVIQKGEDKPAIYIENIFDQPNDLAIAADGTLYASDPKGQKGRILRITRGADGKGRGEVMTRPEPMGRPNGIDLSPDGTTLYVSEPNTRRVWAYKIDGTKLIASGPLAQFEKGVNKKKKTKELDGLRTDVDGKIFVTRPGDGDVVVLAPDGKVVHTIPLMGDEPSNLTFGGPDGKTVFVTQVDGGFIEAFRVDRPGREPCLQVASMC